MKRVCRNNSSIYILLRFPIYLKLKQRKLHMLMQLASRSSEQIIKMEILSDFLLPKQILPPSAQHPGNHLQYRPASRKSPSNFAERQQSLPSFAQPKQILPGDRKSPPALPS
ncbi:hypothetical protein VC83_02452 [Pseudogymnoascus destructans]|uniref:Uncharacterized protein n=2 Tax=Pseudogymnoascus destructans TaxID=655981 RepID=L8FPZ1_PSED2|nr:uncharacterized protein VC83_02452 [Pseudogymnoascus destructans]ELR03035.1 hypothetical protein GMDG_05885 [Pseudogymnoascus destructans 20631-21]OAF61237.1 hypothetical protein VC83_02452 [Pseudogymnoascus destructans]